MATRSFRKWLKSQFRDGIQRERGKPRTGVENLSPYTHGDILSMLIFVIYDLVGYVHNKFTGMEGDIYCELFEGNFLLL